MRTVPASRSYATSPAQYHGSESTSYAGTTKDSAPPDAARCAAARRARAAPRVRARRCPAAGSGRRRGRASWSGSTCPRRSRPLRSAPWGSRARRRREPRRVPSRRRRSRRRRTVRPPCRASAAARFTRPPSRGCVRRRAATRRARRRVARVAAPGETPLDRRHCARARPASARRRLQSGQDAAPSAVVSSSPAARPARRAVGLELHEQVVRRRAAVDAQFRERHAGVALHRVDHVGGLKGDRFERGAREVRARRAAREPDDRAARVRIPVRRAEPGERGHEAARRRCRRRCARALRRPPSVAMMPSRRAATARPRRSTKTLPSSAYVDASGSKPHAIVVSNPCSLRHGAIAGVEHDERSRCRRCSSRRPGAKHGLAEERGLLVARDAGDADRARRAPPARRCRTLRCTAAPRAAARAGCRTLRAARRSSASGGCRRASCATRW